MTGEPTRWPWRSASFFECVRFALGRTIKDVFNVRDVPGFDPLPDGMRSSMQEEIVVFLDGTAVATATLTGWYGDSDAECFIAGPK